VILKYCEQYGFDAEGIRARLSLLNLGPGDHALGRQLQDDVIRPNLEWIAETFYAELLRQPPMRRYLDNDALVTKLKHTQKNYLLGLGVDFDQPAYFEERLRVGLAHARVGIPLNLYVCAYRLLTQLVHDSFPATLRADADLCKALGAFVLKIATLDMSLAIETYHRARLSDLEQSIETLREEEGQLRRLATTDALTGLANHAYVVSVLARALEDARVDRAPLCLVMADLDHFKQINDTYGHLVGDGVLREVAARLRAAVRDVDVVGRYGGEEFMVVFYNTSLATAHEISERVRARVGGTPVKVQNLTIGITISVGLAQALPVDGVNTLMKRADGALYSAKERGRNRVVIADHPFP
jgi:diguanylate cyclase (GGDEF)-like protein